MSFWEAVETWGALWWRRFGVHIVAGSIILPDEAGRLYNVAYLFGPDGRVIGTQRKIHLFHIEQGWGVTPGHQINVFDTSVGKLAFPSWKDTSPRCMRSTGRGW